MSNLTNRYSVKCPLCGAKPQEPCSGKRGPRVSVHRERYDRKLKINRKKLKEQP